VDKKGGFLMVRQIRRMPLINNGFQPYRELFHAKKLTYMLKYVWAPTGPEGSRPAGREGPAPATGNGNGYFGK
jgi:hypothetical protein